MQFAVLNHRDQPGLFILGSLEEIFTLLEDNQVSLQTMLGSRFIRDIQVYIVIVFIRVYNIDMIYYVLLLYFIVLLHLLCIIMIY